MTGSRAGPTVDALPPHSAYGRGEVPGVARHERLIATVGGAAIGLIAVVASWEGKPTTEPHWDRIGKVWDVCYADTQIEKRTTPKPNARTFSQAVWLITQLWCWTAILNCAGTIRKFWRHRQ